MSNDILNFCYNTFLSVNFFLLDNTKLVSDVYTSIKTSRQGQEATSEYLQSEADHPDQNGLPAVDKSNGEQWPDWRWPMYTRHTHDEQSKVQRSRGSIKHHLKVLSHSPLRTFSLPPSLSQFNDQQAMVFCTCHLLYFESQLFLVAGLLFKLSLMVLEGKKVLHADLFLAFGRFAPRKLLICSPKSLFHPGLCCLPTFPPSLPPHPNIFPNPTTSN